MANTTTRNRKKGLPITDDIRVVYDAAYAKKNRACMYREAARGISPWLNRLVTAYKARGVFPVTPAILGDFYDDHADRAVATIIGSFCLSARNPDAIMRECEAMRGAMGESPYADFFAGRRYTLMSMADVMDERIGGFGSMTCLHVSKVVDGLWRTWGACGGEPLEKIFRRRMLAGGTTPYDTLAGMADMGFVKSAEYRVNLALMALCDDDGMSYRLWDIGASRALLRPPMERWLDNYTNMPGFMNALLPKCTKYGFSVSEVADLVGLKKPTDLWYAYHAYKLVCRDAGVGAFMRRYHSQVKNGSTGANNREQLRLMEPMVGFGD